MGTAKRRERTDYNREWRQRNAERLRERSRAYREKNRDRIRAYHAAWRERNPDRVRSYRASPEAQERAHERHRKRYHDDEEYRKGCLERAKRRHLRAMTDPQYREKYLNTVRRYRETPKGKATRKRKELRVYGLSLEAYEAMRATQRNLCAICGKPESRRKRGGPEDLTVDHDHTTGLVRGLLCRNCNRGLGLLGDDLVSLERVIHYLQGQPNADRTDAPRTDA